MRAVLIGVAAILLSACADKQNATITYDQYVDRMTNQSETSLVEAWGIPKNTHTLANGGRIIEYTKNADGEVVCTTRFTIDSAGKIVKWWYRGDSCRTPTAI